VSNLGKEGDASQQSDEFRLPVGLGFLKYGCKLGADSRKLYSVACSYLRGGFSFEDAHCVFRFGRAEEKQICSACGLGFGR
jgi:hypothetical protein